MALGDANTDKQALLQFKSVVSNPQNALSDWNSVTSHCHWFGVTCTNDQDRVDSLRLAGLGLSGAITPYLSNLTSLVVLDLFNNSFYGQIPREFYRLNRLQHIILATNFLNGTIPASLSQCYNLKEISLEHNNLTGDLPSELGHLQRLEILDVAVNNLTGAIPPSFGNLSSLSTLSLARNKFFGNIPNELGNLQKLITLQLSENLLTGNIPHSIFNVSSLIYLSLTVNNLSGEIPTEISPKLEELYLANNKLEGLIPTSLSNATKMQALDLSSNNLQGTVPLFGRMKDVVILVLGTNSLYSTTYLNLQIFHSLMNCTQLQLLWLNSNQLAGELPGSVANLSTHLQQLCVDDNFLTGSFPQGFRRLKNLTALALHQNSFSGEIPSSIGELRQLSRLTVQRNRFSGQIPDIFSNLTQLTDLTMGYNNFYGKIPPSIGKCQHLGTLGLRWNRLDGSIPTEIFGLSGLTYLYLEQNALTGSLPIEVGRLAQIEIMDISRNMLSGNIPATIGACLSLRNLSLARNQLNGFIPPDSITKLAALESLDLSSNNLSGLIPKDLEYLRFLDTLNLSFNDLEGQVPRNGVFLNLNYDSLQGNDKLCGSDQEFSKRLGVPMCTTKKKSNTHLLLKVMIPLAIAIVAVSVIFFILVFIYRKKIKRNTSLSFPTVKGLPQLITYSEIRRATNDFAAENLIGKGGFGSVYKGAFGPGDDGVYTTMAIKVIDLQISKACKSFNAECEALRNVRHRNLVKVFTSCSSIDHKEAEFKALVMEFMANGNLDQWLYPQDTECGTTLTLTQRLNISIDVASAMDYLHHDCDPPVVHCDLKPRNILLDDNMVAHVGDFGLAKFLYANSPQKESSTIGLKGSIGYIAPEYGLGSKASTKGDVYSFGVLLLEMFTARKPTDEMFQECSNLNKFDSAVHKNHILGIVDPILLKDEEYSEQGIWTSSSNGAERSSSSGGSSSNIAINNWCIRREECLIAAIIVGLSCAAQLAKDRLTMRETLTKLHEIKTFLLS